MRPLYFLLLLVTVTIAGCNCGASGIGNRCQEDGECETGLCYGPAAGGYCTTVCSVEGDTGECPGDTVCKPIHGGPMRCLLICESSNECPQPSSCVSVSNSDFKACEPL